MNRCPLTYEMCEDQKYSQKGLKALSRNLKRLNDFPFTPEEQIKAALEIGGKLSIQGVQPKLSVVLNVAKNGFEIVEKGGTYIVKPPQQLYKELPENEDLSMKLASKVGIEVPLHGMMYNIDGSLSYFIKRFDRLSAGQKIAVEDFSQLMGFSRETKYSSSMEQVIGVINQYCSFPHLEKIKLWRLVIFCFLIGNEDLHLKNLSLISRNDKVELSPAYDLLNSTITRAKVEEEMALPIQGKKSHFKRAHLVDYFGKERLGLDLFLLEKELSKFETALDTWIELISKSFLSSEMKQKYVSLIKNRLTRLKNLH